jgi:decaprenylphospho-beta-D-ribofuranose 2-oxidase
MSGAPDWPSAPQSSYLAKSFDGAVSITCALQKPDRYAFFAPGATTKFAVARGAGLSYVAASFGRDSVSVDMSLFDRVLAFCDKTGVVEVEAGISLADLYHFLIARNFYLPVQPGHPRISIGGCIAADIHGKNQCRDGTFIKQVLGLKLFHPNHGIVDLSHSEQPVLFQATCGGYGTTGIIVSARLRCSRVPGNAVEVNKFKVSTLREGIDRMRSLALDRDFVYSWHDFTPSGPRFGRGYVAAGKFVSIPSAPANQLRIPPISKNLHGRWPIGIFTPPTTRAINMSHAIMCGRDTRHLPLHEALFPVHGSEQYFRAFGAGGFHEFQAIIPHGRFEEYATEIKAAAVHHRIAITLASAKLFSGASTFVRFDGDGVCFAINFPRNRRSASFLNSLDRLLLQVGGRPNLIKDSRLPRLVAEAAYPELPRLRSVLREWDKTRVFRSELSSRLGL